LRKSTFERFKGCNGIFRIAQSARMRQDNRRDRGNATDPVN
jgi:hypothetical protein